MVVSDEQLKFLNSIQAIYKKVYDPATFSWEKFDLDTYLNTLLECVGIRFGLPYIVLRLRDRECPHILKIRARHGVVGDIEKAKVTIHNRLASDLQKKEHKKGVLIENIEKSTSYDQKEYARQEGFVSLFARGLEVDDRFEGFVIFFAKDGNFCNKPEFSFIRDNLCDDINDILRFAESLRRIRAEYRMAIKKADLNISRRSQVDSSNTAVERGLTASCLARSYMVEDNFPRAAALYEEAGEILKDSDDIKAADDFLDAAIAHTKNGDEASACRAYEEFMQCIDIEAPKNNHDLRFNRLLEAVDKNGWRKFGGKVYLGKMDKRLLHARLEFVLRKGRERVRALLRILGLRFWWITAKYGESATQLFISSLVVIGVFAFIYSTHFWWEGSPFKLTEKHEFHSNFLLKSRDVPNPFLGAHPFLHNICTAVSFSVVVFTTLGFGNITPDSGWAQLAVDIEVLLGYVFLAMGITVCARKVLR